MNYFDGFKYQLDSDRVLKSVRPYIKIDENSDINNRISKLSESLFCAVKPYSVYKIEKKPEIYDFSTIRKCEYVFYCLITIGDEINFKIEELFKKECFSEAIILDSMASLLLFDYSNQLYSKLFEKANDLKLGLTCRISPGDDEIPIEYQSDIVKRFGDSKEHGFSIEQKFMLRPFKSMSYIYGADKGIAINSKDHDCLNCPGTNCIMRKRGHIGN